MVKDLSSTRAAVSAGSGDFEVEGSVVALGLRLPIARLMAEMRRGNVQGLVERGLGEDEGRHRLSFRYGGRVFQMIVGRDGQPIGGALLSPALPGEVEMLKARLRRELVKQVQVRTPITYCRLAERIAAPRSKAVDRIVTVLQASMEEDTLRGRPLLASLAVEQSLPGLPAPWFFEKAAALGLFAGKREDVEGFAFHARELRRAVLFYDGATRRAGRAGSSSSRPC